MVLSFPGSASASPSELLWEDRFDTAGSIDVATAIVSDARRVYAAGYGVNAAGNFDFLVRTYSAKTGDVLWRDEFDMAGGDDAASSIATDGTHIFAAGRVASPGEDPDLLIRAYMARSGDFLWEDVFDVAGGFDEALAVAADGRQVLVAGGGTNAAGNFDFLVRAYDGRSGALLWRDQVDVAGSHDVAEAIATDGRRVFAAGGVTNALGDLDLAVRAYDARTGIGLWNDQFDAAGGSDAAKAIATDGTQVLVAGFATSATGGGDFLVRAYESKTGAIRWEDQVDKSGGGDTALAAATSHGRAYVTGFATSAAGDFDFLVRAYDARTGESSWEDQFDAMGRDDQAFAISSDGRRVFVAGAGTNIAGDRDFILRAHDGRTGSILWEDQVDKAGGDDAAFAVATGHGLVFAAGQVGTFGNLDFILRAHDSR